MALKTILMTTDGVGGVWTYCMELAGAFRHRSANVVLASMGNALSPAQAQEAARQSNLVLLESTFRLEWMTDAWADVSRAGDWLLDLEHQWIPDIVHLNGYAHGALPWRSPVLIAGHSCVLSWWEAVKGVAAPASWDTYRQKVTHGLHAAQTVVAPSHAMLASLRKYYGPLPNGMVIYNGRSSSNFGIAAKEPYLLAVGRLWDEAKNIQLLAQLADRLPWPIYAVGESSGKELSAGLWPLGVLPPSELTDWLRRASIFVHPARYEPFGLSILEAALSGCALVIGDIQSLRELWEGAAMFVSPDNPEQALATLQELIRNESLRRALAQKAHSRAMDYGPERMADAYLAVYEGLQSPSLAANLTKAHTAASAEIMEGC